MKKTLLVVMTVTFFVTAASPFFEDDKKNSINEICPDPEDCEEGPLW